MKMRIRHFPNALFDKKWVCFWGLKSTWFKKKTEHGLVFGVLHPKVLTELPFCFECFFCILLLRFSVCPILSIWEVVHYAYSKTESQRKRI